MSLISDALKKARQEAALQDSLRQAQPYAMGTVEPERRGTVMPLLAGLGAGCLLAAALFAVAYLSGWGPFGKPARQAVQVAEASPAPPAPVVPSVAPPISPISPTSPIIEERSQPAPPVAVPTPTPAQIPPPPLAPSPEVRPRPAPIQAPPPVVEAPSIRIEPSAPPATPAPLQPSPLPSVVPEAPAAATVLPLAPPAGDAAEPRAYVREVPVPGGGTLHLNGIAFSADHPIVVIDGRVMGPGETTEGFTVVEIQSGRVKLQGHGQTVFVSLK
jgi:hypothetical protein